MVRLEDGTDVSSEDVRECVLSCYEELLREHGRPPTMREMGELTGVPLNYVKAILVANSKPLTDGRRLRYQGRR